MIEPAPLQQIERTFVRFGKRKLSYFSGCDYFRLASHPRVIAALQAGLKKYGLNVAASRLTTGNHVIYRKLEKSLRNFFNAEDALLLPSGYLTNLVVAQALAGNFSHALLDEMAHPSLTDAARFLDCPILEFKHCDPEDLARSIERCGPHSKVILLTDGMFSHDGSATPLAEYLRIFPRDGLMLVDDAHGAGLLGKSGRGVLEHCGVGRDRIIQTVTLSKAFGVYGGAILGTMRLRQRILERSRLFVGSTPLPLPLASAALQAVEVLKTDKGLRQRLFRNVNYVKTALRGRGLSLRETPGPIIALFPKGRAEISRLQRALLAADIYPPFINYPGAPADGYFRFVISSEHRRDQLERLVEVVIQNANRVNRC